MNILAAGDTKGNIHLFNYFFQAIDSDEHFAPNMEAKKIINEKLFYGYYLVNSNIEEKNSNLNILL